MRIAFVAPWFRTLAHLYGRLLQEAGHEVLVVTSDRHFEDSYGFCDEVAAPVLGVDPARATAAVLRARRAVRAFRPDVVVEDVLSDPRWQGAGGRARRVLMLHDPRPHDDSHRLLGIRSWSAQRQLARADGLLCFSETSAAILRARTSRPVTAVPLLSEVPEEWVRLSPTKRGFLMLGRLSVYKGFDLGLRAWQGLSDSERAAHPLRCVVSEGDPALLERLRASGASLTVGRFSFREVTEQVSSASALLLPYAAASQSGVQLMSLQHATAPLVSDLPGLAEYQVPGQPPVAEATPEAWTRRLREHLAQDAGLLGSRARQHYLDTVQPARVLAALEQALAAPRTAVAV